MVLNDSTIFSLSLSLSFFFYSFLCSINIQKLMCCCSLGIISLCLCLVFLTLKHQLNIIWHQPILFGCIFTFIWRSEGILFFLNFLLPFQNLEKGNLNYKLKLWSDYLNRQYILYCYMIFFVFFFLQEYVDLIYIIL